MSKEKKLSKKVEELVEEISKISVLELSDLVNELQEKLGVSAVPVANPTGQAALPPTEEAQNQQSSSSTSALQTVIMTGSGENKIAVIKALREINPNLGLKEAKDMTEQLPAEILKEAKADDAKSASDKLKAAGATVELK
ncbi:MAG: 50S ribosomal protein L7/L12 [Patescibacteria group bacterium]